ncbi:MAG: dephospho-CoA kinase [Cyclobacteriaceae bacterium]|nr:dephospho-CoA kinase [Cyclobacteriaceae bacterium]UYN87081.1 MAG: dephospho-CoA kinase [Cyclobacteriaceae bacterium]
MKRPLQIGITGGIGSGKSLVCRMFACLGVPVYDADSRAKSVMTTDGILVMQIKKEFGGLSYHADGSLNRNYLAGTVFNNPERLEVLNKLVHPRVGEDYLKWLDKQREHAYVLKEAALLYESGSYKALDKVIVVHAPEAVRVARVKQRDPHRSEQDIKGIIKNQMDAELKLAHADFVVMNDNSQMVLPQVLKLHQLFTQGINN